MKPDLIIITTKQENENYVLFNTEKDRWRKTGKEM
jgi:hypothetical protein